MAKCISVASVFSSPIKILMMNMIQSEDKMTKSSVLFKGKGKWFFSPLVEFYKAKEKYRGMFEFSHISMSYRDLGYDRKGKLWTKIIGQIIIAP